MASNFVGEQGYLDSVQYILDHGVERDERTGVGTIACFGIQMRFQLDDGFPLLTTKRVSFKSIAEELLWFIRGDTCAKTLSDKGVKIWNANGSRDFLDSRGLIDREVGDLGPIYGFQWRHFNAEYTTCHDEYERGGVDGFDQLQWVIDEIQENPNSRRLLVSTWNPPQISLMALPPCHISFQFAVMDRKLSCLLYQRSGDMGLGVPYNIASYALLLILLCKVGNFKPGNLTGLLCDCHIYENHIENAHEQIKREPKELPIVSIDNSKPFDIFKWTHEDFKVYDYFSHPKIKFPIAV